MLVEHRVHDMDECLVAGKKHVPPGEEVAFQPPLAGVFAEDLHHPAVGGKVVVILNDTRHPGAVGDL